MQDHRENVKEIQNDTDANVYAVPKMLKNFRKESRPKHIQIAYLKKLSF